MLQRRTRTRFIVGAAALLIGALAACGSHETISGPQVIQFRLDSIDGQVLPHEISRSADGTVTTAVTDMILSLTEDAKWRTVGHQRVTTNGVAQDQLLQGSGTFVVFDPNATFRDANGDIVWEGEVTNGDFKLKDTQGQVYYFALTR